MNLLPISKLIGFFILTCNLISLQCTTIGFHEKEKLSKMDFGELQTVNICTFYEPGISVEEIDDLFSYWNKELALYKIKVQSIEPIEKERPGFYGSDILQYLYSIDLNDKCDRILYLKGRNWKDLIYEGFTLGIFAGIGLKFEIQGAVETRTNTRGYIKAKYISTLQLLFTSPKSTLVHEGYHLLGCGHQLFMEECYKAIQNVKQLSNQENIEPNFFPTISGEGKKFTNRSQVNRVLKLE
ncbi:MAG: hypothetical protein MH321_01840 [Leptospiraceae bacterium]|nr:hypothetical protein [Leptospiraceae bacterium]